jgi:hypothetical protein
MKKKLIFVAHFLKFLYVDVTSLLLMLIHHKLEVRQLLEVYNL